MIHIRSGAYAICCLIYDLMVHWWCSAKNCQCNSDSVYAAAFLPFMQWLVDMQRCSKGRKDTRWITETIALFLYSHSYKKKWTQNRTLSLAALMNDGFRRDAVPRCGLLEKSPQFLPVASGLRSPGRASQSGRTRGGTGVAKAFLASGRLHGQLLQQDNTFL